MLKRSALLAAVLLIASSSQVFASEQITVDSQTPGVDSIITKPPGVQAGQGSTPPDGAGSGDNSTGGSGAGSGSGSGAGTPVTNECTGNLGVSSEVSLADLTERLDACTAEAAEPAAGGDAPEPVDAAQLAQQISSRLDLVTPQPRTSPSAPVKALVGLETWMWVPDGQWQPLTDSATLGGTTVTVEATPVQTRWDMGESSKVCNNPGRAWRKGLGQRAQTPCGYTYSRTSVREPNKKYEISAVLRYSISWTCEGECTEPGGNLGTLDSAPAGAALQVSERQSVVTLR